MTKEDFEKQKQLIIEQFGQPERDFDRTPLNESARRIDQLNSLGLQAFNEKRRLAKAEQLIKKELKEHSIELPVPPSILRPEMLISFADKQKEIVQQWFKDTNQSPKQIAEALDIPVNAVRAVLSLEAFKILKGHLALAWKESLNFEALAALQGLLQSRNEAVRKDVAKLILLDAGIFKEDTERPELKAELKLDAETEEKLRKLGDTLI